MNSMVKSSIWQEGLSQFWQSLRATARIAEQWLLIAIHWQYSPHVAVLVMTASAIAIYFAAYRKWESGWLSHHVDIAMRNMRRQRSRRWFSTIPKGRHFTRTVLHYCFVGTRTALRYVAMDVRQIHLYLPTYTSIIVLGSLVAIILLLSHWPAHPEIFWHPLRWPGVLRGSFSKDEAEGLSHVFEALIAIIIALIVFVAESIRGSRSADQKRILLKMSKLWILVVLITLSPLAFLDLPLTGFSTILAVAMAILTIWGFAQVLLNLLDPDRNIREQRNFLKERVRSIVLLSARQRVGNRILFDLLKRGGTSGMEAASSRSFLPGKQKDYLFIKSPQTGIIDDIDVAALGRLGRFLTGQEEQSRDVSSASVASDQTSGPSPTAPQAADKKAVPRSFLVRRFRERISDEPTFSGNADILAIPKIVADRKGVLDEINGVLGTIFRFTKSEPPSTAFRREMRSTKDRLLSFIQTATLGEVEELRDSYRLVADEFLTTLNELGGGYSADSFSPMRRNELDGNGYLHCP